MPELSWILGIAAEIGAVALGGVIFSTTCRIVVLKCTSWEYARQINGGDDDAKMAVKNLAKGIVLAALTPCALLELARIFLYDEWRVSMLHILGIFYTQLDFGGLLLMNGSSKLSTRTMLHHMSVVALAIANATTDYGTTSVMRCAVLLAAFSAIAFPVNLYIGVRKFLICAHVERNVLTWRELMADIDQSIGSLARFSLYVYTVSLALNWTTQLYMLFWDARNSFDMLPKIVYMVLLAIIVYDDIELWRFLRYQSRATCHSISRTR